MTTKINLKDMRFHAHHGVMPQETIVGNDFIVNLTITAPLDKALESDSLDDTINYASIYEIVKEEMKIPSKLLEHVAGRIIKSLKENFDNLEEISLELAKLNPPFGADVKSASVIVNEKIR